MRQAHFSKSTQRRLHQMRNQKEFFSYFNQDRPEYPCRMLSLARWFPYLCSFALLVTSAPLFSAQTKPPSAAAPIVAGGLGKGTIPLHGLWQFHQGDNAAWSSPALDDSPWDSSPPTCAMGAQRIG